MSKDKISDYSATANSNTDIAGINIDEGCAPSGINNAIRTLMAQLKNFQTGASGDDVTVGGVLTVKGASINDTNGNELFKLTATASAVNELTVANAATGGSPTLSATGGDTNIGINLVTKGTGGVVFPAGAVATPAITTTGDLNTGIYFPAADTVGVTTDGTERVRVDSSGNVGIGTSSPSTYGKFAVAGTIATVPDNNGYALYAGRYSSGFDFATFNTPASTTGYVFQINGSEKMRIDSSGNLQFNSGYGSVATAYGCRAWVNFNGTGTPAIRASGNVSSITDNGTGDYTITFSTSMPDSNYTFVTDNLATGNAGYSYGYSTYSASAFRMRTIVGAALTDHATVTGAVFR